MQQIGDGGRGDCQSLGGTPGVFFLTGYSTLQLISEMLALTVEVDCGTD